VASRRVDVRAILASVELRRKLMVSTIQATQAREGISTTSEQADRAYYVVTEAERATFFELERFKGGKRDEPDRRHEMFVRAIRDEAPQLRHDVARRDFAVIDGQPLAYERLWIVAPIFREAPALESTWALARQGKASGDDPRWVRFRWEVPRESGWVPFAKGGDYCRFYADIELVLDWKPEHRAELKASGNALPSEEHYFKPGLTWPLAGSEFGVRFLPPGCVFAHKGPAVILKDPAHSAFLAGIMNSAPAEFLLRTLISRKDMGGRWEVGVIKRLPVPQGSSKQVERVSEIATAIHDAKRDWDGGNEVSTFFREPWILRAADTISFVAALDAVLGMEASREAEIRALYDELNDEAYLLYGISPATRAKIEESLGERPAEVLWPQMEGKTVEQKRMEHVWRLLSFAVKRVIEADDDGIVAFAAASGEVRLGERVRHELASLFRGRDESQLEVEFANELKRVVKGYRRCQGIDDWLENVFFEYHASLYKSRPIYWHIASSQGTAPFAFGALVHYHRFDKNRMAKLRSSYLRDTIEELRREAGLADKTGRADDRVELQARVEEAQALDKKLQGIQEGRHEGTDGGPLDYRILTPWKEASARPRGWTPDIDDGVQVNIAPLERAGVLRVTGIAG
jgi:hypothetical protein